MSLNDVVPVTDSFRYLEQLDHHDYTSWTAAKQMMKAIEIATVPIQQRSTRPKRC